MKRKGYIKVMDLFLNNKESISRFRRVLEETSGFFTYYTLRYDQRVYGPKEVIEEIQSNLSPFLEPEVYTPTNPLLLIVVDKNNNNNKDNYVIDWYEFKGSRQQWKQLLKYQSKHGYIEEDDLFDLYDGIQ